MDEINVKGCTLTEEQARDMLMVCILTGSEIPDIELNGEKKKLSDIFVPSFEMPSKEELEEIRNFCIEQNDFALYTFNICNISKLSAFPYHILTFDKKRHVFLNIGAMMEVIRNKKK